MAGFLILVGAACTSTAGKKVILTYDREDVQDCRLLKRLKETAGTWAFGTRGGPSTAGEGWNENEMRNDTAELGGNVVLAIDANRGEAYLCPDATLARISEAGPITPTPTPAVKPAE